MICRSIGSRVFAALRVRDTISSPCRQAMATSASNMKASSATADEKKQWPLAAVATMTSVGNQDENFAVCRRLAERRAKQLKWLHFTCLSLLAFSMHHQEAKQQNAAMLFLPECCSFIGTDQAQTVSKAEPLSGAVMQRYQKLAKDTNLWLSIGGFQEVGPDEGHMYNCHVILSNTGEIKAAYRKVHLFDVDVPNGPILMESRSTAPGKELVACDSPVGRLGVTICYDLRFPEVYQRLTFDQGAQILLMPSAFTKKTGEAHWELLLKTRAVECQCYVIAAAQAGKHNHKRESYGHSLIIDPWGRIIGKQDDPMATGIALARIDLDYLKEVRVKMPIDLHRLQGRTCIGL